MAKLSNCQIVKLLIVFLFFFFFYLSPNSYFLSPSRADELEEIEKQISELQKALNQSQAATKPLEDELGRLDSKLKSIQASVAKADQDIVDLEQSIAKREKEFEKQYVLLAEKVESYYKSLYRPSAFFTFLASKKASDLTKDFFYRQIAADEDKKIIAQISEDILTLETDKKRVEQDKERLAVLRQKTDEQAEFFRKEVKGARDYQEDLSKQIAKLSARQKQLLAEKLGSLNLPQTLGAGPLYCTDDRKLNPGFSPAFAFYTYGIPHRVGMNQYGAYGRAKAGQNYHQILAAYFNATPEKRGNINLTVQGYGSMPLEQYMLGIYEVPDSWPMEALKAQAVAARSYALAYTNNGAGEICTTQACQVYKGGNKGGNWEQAVKQTEGEVLVNGGQPIKAWYSSTDGGYTFTSGDVWGSNKPWTKRLRDTDGGVGSFADLQSRAYDRESPCFYSAQGWRAEHDKSAWLRPNEVADIVNVLLLAKKDIGTQKHLSQVDKPNPDGVETWDAGKVKSELRSRGVTPYNSISSVSIGWDKGTGQTTSVNLAGDGGSVSFGGQEFKDYFNLRAPANIQIVGPLYDVERK